MRLILVVGMLAQGACAGAEVPEEIEDVWITQVNKLPPRGNHWGHPDAKSAKGAGYGEGPWVRSLNGAWRFKWRPIT